ncbi:MULTISPECIES: NDMA-dependent alcohol dehydrogenase [unclassified Rhodococcus (in: high G+C Gram-positive bacteria)]|uniref:NDMA-dependent alcohol dehydrogenase n=1 Tax=unclassified Rhodococcus (in: high G+C Gram-positive bacteria) TaxID=192944 RepID=UPI00163ADB60|nr:MULTISPECIES: NDMA-dependent alcohol dehydrogenase [unclassified Rhodococcus (in: high G+C Gram-positive bacteria)]MBC2637583.1 NDMA-dependent alcohol dehydrogenase [Rhodococcus sp. 3A]MBC2644280.1 NDMA-dependent alcohol dehydrogenase [Rhodococcus sp. 3A]MBC2890983.1 NDMA-dependent alcohol dehydrogenase [Rhodococcus sp. 4CII]MBC2897672.1 NDMA-dependent alcohol dehydrogenase [Rhodococcus sp. 4CII]
MRTRAAILTTAPGKYETTEVDLDAPRQNEITVELVASGLCHSDDHYSTGDILAGNYPLCGGHEGSGVVVDVGPHTPGWQVGDHVVFSFVPSCGKCRWCAEGKQNLCDIAANMLIGARFDDPTSFRMALNGAPVGQVCGVGSFSQYTTVSVDSAVKVDKEIPLAMLSLVGCGVATGWGSSVHAAGARPNHTVVVMGIGGIGASALQGAAHVGARDIIAVDPVAFKRTAALELGATHAVETIEEATDLARSMTNGQGADSVVVSVGVTTGEHVGQAMNAIRKAGTVVVTGAGPVKVSDVPINLIDLTMSQKRIVGALFGMSSPREAIPRLASLYKAGRLKLDEMVTKEYTLDEVAQGYEDMHAGTIIRGMVSFR